jgi:hypothetical protein
MVGLSISVIASIFLIAWLWHEGVNEIKELIKKRNGK